MTIGGTNISTYGFFLSEVSGLYNRQARKRILKETAVEAEDIVFTGENVSVVLVGEFTSYTAVKIGIDALLVRISVERAYVFLNYSKTVTGFVTNGAKVEVNSLVIKVKFSITN